MQLTDERTGEENRVIAILTGTDCDYCGEGELTDGIYKETRAVICDECNTPQARFC